MIRVGINTFRVSDGTTVDIPESGVTLFVGPNNSGKSQSLRDLSGLCNSPNYVGRAITQLDLRKEGSAEQFATWVANNVPVVRQAGQSVFALAGYGTVAAAQLAQLWQQPALTNFASLFLYHADAATRLTAGNSVASADFATQAPQSPIQLAYLAGELERALSRAAMAAFGEGIVVDRYGGGVISLRVGEAPIFEHDSGVPRTSFLDALKRLPTLEEQGDGVRSYLGLLLHVLSGSHSITLVDEPEAFLHPPQARLLGRVLAERSASGQQVFMATHSTAVVQGVLDGGADVTIVRVTRRGEVNSAAVLDSEAVRQLWADPLLRYSNVLDGLFHDAVVLCESDSDCRYYGSVLDSIVSESNSQVGTANEEVTKRPQALFAHCGGKARLASVAASLRAVSIPVVVVADFDLLKDADDVRRIVDALGGDFAPLRANLGAVNSALTADARPVTKLALKEELIRRIDDLPLDTVGRKEMERLRSLLRVDSGWERAKRAGKEALPQGDAYRCGTELLEHLKAASVLVVPVGELERFVPGVEGHGPAWVTEVHRQGLHDDAANKPPRDFLRNVIAAAGLPIP